VSHGCSSPGSVVGRTVRLAAAVLFLALFAASWAPGAAHAGATTCKATGNGDKLCKTYGLRQCSGGACRKWVNRCELKKSGAFYCNYEATETRCSGGCRTLKTVCYSSSKSQSCVTTDPDTCRASASGYRTCSSSTNTCKTYGRYYRCVFDQAYTSCRKGRCKEVEKTCRSGSNLRSTCTVSVRKFRTDKPAATTDESTTAVDGASDDSADATGVAVATGACPDPDTYVGTPDQVPPGYYDGCPGIDS
jgi:hypothetical protein